MRHIKKIMSYFVTLAMIFSIVSATGAKVHAEDATYKLTLTGTSTGHQYEVYQIFSGDLSTDGDGNKVLSNVAWGDGVSYTGSETAAEVAKALGDKTMSTDDLEEKLTLTTPVKTVESQKDTTIIEGLKAGYYLVKDQDGTAASTDDGYTTFVIKVVGDATAKIKSGVPTVEKKVKDVNDSTGKESDYQDSADYDIGDDVPYQITGTMPANIADYKTYKYVFTDKMSKGLTYNNDHKIIIGNTDVTNSFTENVTKNEDGTTTVTLSIDNLKGITGVTIDASTKVIVTYTAKLNENATVGSAGNPNTVDLTYSNNPNKGGEGDTSKTPEDKNIVFTYKTIVNKIGEDKNPLKGAGFTLYKKTVNKTDGTTEYKKVKTIDAGDTTTFEFSGLDDGDYRLVESTTPDGYNTIDPIEFTISANHGNGDDPQLIELKAEVTSGEATFTNGSDKGSLTTDVVNKKGSILPETGGMGTTLLYVVGGVLVAMAAAYVVMNKKHSTNK